MNKERQGLVEWAIEAALKNGADQTSVSLAQVRSVDIKHRDHKLEEVKESTQNGISIEIYSNQKYSSRSTSDLRKDKLKNFIIEAIKATRYMGKDEFRALPDPSLYPKDLSRDLNINDPSHDGLKSSRRIQIAQSIENAAWEAGKDIISVTAEFSDTYANRILANSNGFMGSTESTSYSCGAEVTVKDGETGRPEDWDWTVSRHYNDIGAVEDLGRNAAQRAMAKVGQKKIESGKYSILVQNRASGNLTRLLTSPMNAASIQQKSSYLEGKLDEQVASPLLTMKDSPFIPKGLGSRLFDGDGIAATERTLIDKGILKGYFVDNYYGRKLGWKPTGSGYGNMEFALGDKSEAELLEFMGDGILITGFIGGNMNSTTGDFSYGIIGQLVKNGKIAHAVNEMNLTGNAPVFWNNLVAVGNDPITYSSQLRPSMVFKDADLSGI